MKWRMAEICKQYHFSAAHHLPYVPEHHKCSRLHGHNYMVELIARGDVNPNPGFRTSGMVVDFYEMDDLMKPIIERLDHNNLNDIIENPTAENLAAWILEQYPVAYIYSVRVWETPKSYAEVFQTDGMWGRNHRMQK